MNMHGQREVVVGLGLAEVSQSGPIGCSYLHELCTRLGHHVRNSEAAADLDQLSSAYSHPSARRECCQHQKHGASAVVHDHCRLGTSCGGK